MKANMIRWAVRSLSLLALSGIVACSRSTDQAVSAGGEHAKPAAKAAWLDDFEAAKALAKETGRLILADFSGSDWCGWCIKLDQEVFRQPAFQTYAAENLVLFLADFPRGHKLPETTVKQNEALMGRYQVEGFPTVLLLSADGKVVGRTGYQKGGAESYIQHLQELGRSTDPK